MMTKQSKKWAVLILGIIIFSFTGTTAGASNTNHKFGIGLGWPYLSFKYGFHQNWAIEARGAYEDEIGVYGMRGYYNLNHYKKGLLFTGLGIDYVDYVLSEDNQKDVEGEGYVCSLFVGGEYFINERFALSADIGPVYVGLSEDEFDLSVSGIEFVVNLGVNFYFK